MVDESSCCLVIRAANRTAETPKAMGFDDEEHMKAERASEAFGFEME